MATYKYSKGLGGTYAENAKKRRPRYIDGLIETTDGRIFYFKMFPNKPSEDAKLPYMEIVTSKSGYKYIVDLKEGIAYVMK